MGSNFNLYSVYAASWKQSRSCWCPTTSWFGECCALVWHTNRVGVRIDPYTCSTCLYIHVVGLGVVSWVRTCICSIASCVVELMIVESVLCVKWSLHATCNLWALERGVRSRCVSLGTPWSIWISVRRQSRPIIRTRWLYICCVCAPIVAIPRALIHVSRLSPSRSRSSCCWQNAIAFVPSITQCGLPKLLIARIYWKRATT
jgi:hypothetical protein